jgi:hypothetical protein
MSIIPALRRWKQEELQFEAAWVTKRDSQKLNKNPGAHTCNPTYLEGEIGRILVRGQSGQIVCETISKITRVK